MSIQFYGNESQKGNVMDQADRILTLALGIALLVIGLLVALLFVDATAVGRSEISIFE